MTTPFTGSVPLPEPFFRALCQAMININHLTAPSTSVFYSTCTVQLENHWIWLPPMLPLAPTTSENLKLLRWCEEVVIRAAGGKYSVKRGRYYHVGKTWGCGEKVLHPRVITPNNVPLWCDTTKYIDHLSVMWMYMRDRMVDQGWPLSDKYLARTEKSYRDHGLLLNLRPAKKRKPRPDPLLELLKTVGFAVPSK